MELCRAIRNYQSQTLTVLCLSPEGEAAKKLFYENLGPLTFVELREDVVAGERAFHDMSISAVPAYFDFGRDPDVARQALPTLEAASYLGAKKLLVIPGFLDQDDPPRSRSARPRPW